MRISADSTDPGHERYCSLLAEGVIFERITLDGKPLEFPLCVVADEERGEVVVFVRGESGELIMDPERPDRLFRRVVRGAVKIDVQRTGALQ